MEDKAHVNETVFDQPDVSKVTPVYVHPTMTRSQVLDVVIINQRGEYQTVKGFWNDIKKQWEHANGGKIEHKVVKTEPISDTEKHY